MAASSALLGRVPRHTIKRVTFTGAAGFGAADDNIVVFNVTGEVLIMHLAAFCQTTCTVSATTTLELGVTGNTAEFIAQIADAASIVAQRYWIGSTVEVNATNSITNKMTSASALLLVGSGGNVTAGVIDFQCLWIPMSGNGNLA